MTLRNHAIEEVHELIDAIEASDNHELAEKLGSFLHWFGKHSDTGGQQRRSCAPKSNGTKEIRADVNR